MIAAPAAYAAAVAYLSWPLVTEAARSVVDPVALGHAGGPWERADLDLLVWILAWVSHALLTQPWSLFQGNVFFPAPDTLASSEHLLGLAPIAAPVFALSHNAVLTYNVTVLVVVWLAAVSTFALTRAWTGDAAAAFLAGAAFAFAPQVTGTWIRLHASAIPFFPLLLLLAWRAARAPTVRNLLLLAAVAMLQLLAGMYVAYEMLALVVAFAPALVVEARRQPRNAAKVLLAIAAAALVLVPIGLPYQRVRAAGELPSFAQMLELVAGNSAPPRQVMLWLGESLTWPVVALATVGLVWPRRDDLVRRCGLLLVALVGIVLSAGTALPLVPGTSLPSPYELAMRLVPGFACMRAPTRFLVLPLLALSVLAAFGGARLASLLGPRARLGRLLLVAGGVALVVARAPERPLPLARVGLDGPQMRAHRYLRDYASPGPVLELPVYNPTAPMDGGLMRMTASYMVGSTLDWFPLLNGYSGYAPGSARLLMTIAQRLPDATAFDDLCRIVAVRWIIVHFALVPEQERAWSEQAQRLGLALVDRFGTDALYRVDRPCRTDESLQARRGATRTLAGTAIAPLSASDLRGSVTSGDVPSPLRSFSHRWFWVEVRNDGTATWPGLSTARTNTIELQARWRDAASGRIFSEGSSVPLARDLAPGETMRAQVSALVPRPGAYVLEVGLVQGGRGWFADSGGAGALRVPVEVTRTAVTAPAAR